MKKKYKLTVLEERKGLQHKYTDKPGLFCVICSNQVQMIEVLDTLNKEWIIEFNERYTCCKTCKDKRNKLIRKSMSVSGFNFNAVYG